MNPVLLTLRRPLAISLSIALISAIGLTAVAQENQLAFGAVVAAAVIAATVVVACLAHTGESWNVSWTVAALGASIAYLAGCGWWLGAQFLSTGNEADRRRETLLLLALAGALLVLHELAHSNQSRNDSDPSDWLASVLMASAGVLVLIVVAEDHLVRNLTAPALSWATAALTSALGAALVVAQISSSLRLSRSSHSRRSAPRQRFGLLLLGSSLVLLGVMLPHYDADHVALPMLVGAIGLLSVLSGNRTLHADLASRSTFSSSTGSVSDEIGLLVGLGSVVLMSVTMIVRWLNHPEGNEQWAKATVAAAVCLTCTVAAGSMLWMHRLRTETLMSNVVHLKRTSQTDPLTNMPNRRALEARLAEELHRADRFDRPLTIGIIDIDDFKRINDAFGHAAGDAVLIAAGSLMTSGLRSIDVVGRFGGEEFLMVLPETNGQGGVVAAERILGDVRTSSLNLPDTDRPLTVSIGIASFPHDGRTPEALLASADNALYAAKRAGKNQIVAAERLPEVEGIQLLEGRPASNTAMYPFRD